MCEGKLLCYGIDEVDESCSHEQILMSYAIVLCEVLVCELPDLSITERSSIQPGKVRCHLDAPGGFGSWEAG